MTPDEVELHHLDLRLDIADADGDAVVDLLDLHLVAAAVFADLLLPPVQFELRIAPQLVDRLDKVLLEAVDFAEAGGDPQRQRGGIRLALGRQLGSQILQRRLIQIRLIVELRPQQQRLAMCFPPSEDAH